MNLIYQSGFLKALGWSLIDSFWQMGLIWLLYIGITANSRKRNAAQRHNLALLSLAGGSAWFIAGFFIHLSSIRPALAQGAEKAFTNPAFKSSFVSSFIDGAAPYLSAVYLVALLFLIARFLCQYRQSLRLFHTGILEPDASLSAFVERTARTMGIAKKVVIGLSTLAHTPLTIGFWKPVILFPVAVFNQLSISQAEAIIVHELHHIKRNDYLINLLLALADIFLFFNPFARILSAIVKNERENSCDDKVMQFQYNPRQYGQALLILEQNRASENNISMAATGRNAPMLLNRIKRLASHKASPSPVLGKLSALLLFLSLAITAQRQEETSTALPPALTGEALQASLPETIGGPVGAFAVIEAEKAASEIPTAKDPAIENSLSREEKQKTDLPAPSSPVPFPGKKIGAPSSPKAEKIAQTDNSYNEDTWGAEKMRAALLQELNRDLQAWQVLNQEQQAPNQYQEALNQHHEKLLQAIEERNLIDAGVNLNDLPMTILIKQLIESAARAETILQAANEESPEAQIDQPYYPFFAGYSTLINTFYAKPAIQLISLSDSSIALAGQSNIIYIIRINPLQKDLPRHTIKMLKTVHL